MSAPPAPVVRVIRGGLRQNLGDMLQRLATIAPDDLFQLTSLTRDVLREAERRHAAAFQNRPDPTKPAA